MTNTGLSWLGIIRLGLVQTSLGAIVILTTSTMNRVMVVELALPAMLPGALVAFHYAIQMLRPRFGYGSDVGGNTTVWIIGGMGVLALGGILAACATALMASQLGAGIALAVLAFLLVGIGVGASGTSLLILLAKRVDKHRRAAAATIVWLMMISGFIVTATLAGHFLDPFSYLRLIQVTTVVSVIAFIVTLIAVYKIENINNLAADPEKEKPSFREALLDVWSEPKARRFTIFVFVSMLAYSAQDLILEPFAGLIFDYTPGESTKLAGVQNGGLLLGMIMVAVIGTLLNHKRVGALRVWVIAGCVASSAALTGLAIAGIVGPPWPLKSSVFALGFANGAFAVAAIASMMELAGSGRASREGIRMGLWGAAQAIAFCLGGFIGTVAIDVTRYFLASTSIAYAIVFIAQGLLFLVAAYLAAGIEKEETTTKQSPNPFDQSKFTTEVLSNE
ncbi:MAG: BCD family MFS transporter [Pseudomonadota bacterium]